MENIGAIIYKIAEIKDIAERQGILRIAQWDGVFNDESEKFNAIVSLQGFYKTLVITKDDNIILMNEERTTIKEIAKELEVMRKYLEFENVWFYQNIWMV